MQIRLGVLTLSLLLFLAGCVKEELLPGGENGSTKGIEGYGSKDSVKRTLLVYMIASNLDNDLQNNLRIITSVATKENLNGGNLLVYYSENKEKASLFEIKPDENGIPVRHIRHSYEDQSAVSKETMRNVIEEVKSLYPSDSYGLLLSSHGTAWMPMRYHTMLRSFGEENGKGFEIDELAEAIPDHLFDFIMFDACSMGAVECMYELKDKADYIVASPSEILTVGFPYQTILPRLFTKEADLANVAKDFYDFFRTYKDFPVGNISVTATKELDRLAAVTKEILTGGEEAVLSLDISGIQVLSYLPKSPVVLVDFGDMIKRLATEEQYRRFKDALHKAVLYPYSTKKIYTTGGGYYDVTEYSGLSVYPLQRDRTNLNNWYRNRLSWYQAVFQ
jgi:hypothetical protein